MRKSPLAKLQPASPVLIALADGFANACDKGIVSAMRELARFAEGTNFSKTPPQVPRDVSVAQMIAVLNGVSAACQAAKSKSTEASFRQLLALLQSATESSDSFAAGLIAMSKAMHPKAPEELVQEFAAQLIAAKGNEPEFEAAFENVKKSNLRREHIVELARRVYGFIDANTSKANALKYVRKLHDTYVATRRKIEAQGGKSAA